jgi:single-strand DNA-binding protein
MASKNLVILMGNLTDDPEVRYTPQGTAVCDFTVAVNRVYKDGNGQRHEETEFLDVTFWGKRAEIICKYFQKGRPIYVEGRIRVEQWEDRETGKKRRAWKIVGSDFQFVGGENRGESTRSAAPPPTRSAAPSPQEVPDDEDDRIPF